MWPFTLFSFSQPEKAHNPFKVVGRGLVQLYPSAMPGHYTFKTIYEFGGRRFFKDSLTEWVELEDKHKLIIEDEEAEG